jgi:hypothetical protein
MSDSKKKQQTTEPARTIRVLPVKTRVKAGSKMAELREIQHVANPFPSGVAPIP